jgi:hypothetical protein
MNEQQYTIEQLKGMKPLEVAMAFKNAGGWRATKRSFMGKPDALEQWQTTHPEFSDPSVLSLLETGQTQVFAQTIIDVSRALTGTEVIVTVLGLGDRGKGVEASVAGSLIKPGR